MTKKISETKPVLEFVELAGKYCQQIEERQKYSPVKFLQEAFILLPQLCLGAVRLPDIKRIPDCENHRFEMDEW